jgi:hypothetical protein
VVVVQRLLEYFISTCYYRRNPGWPGTGCIYEFDLYFRPFPFPPGFIYLPSSSTSAASEYPPGYFLGLT